MQRWPEGSLHEGYFQMTILLTTIHIIVCLFLVVIVLLQHGKGADVGATFGGSGDSLFGTEGPVPLMNKITTAAAIIFMMTSISLAYISANKSTDSVMSDFKPAAPVEKPAQTAVPVPDKVPMPDPAPGDKAAAPVEFPGGPAKQTEK